MPRASPPRPPHRRPPPPRPPHRGPPGRPAADDVTEPHGIRRRRLGALLGARRHRVQRRAAAVLRSIAAATTTSPSPGRPLLRRERGGGPLVPLRDPAGRRRGTPSSSVSGNHESNGENGDIQRFTRCLPNRRPVVGTYGRQWYVDQPADHPLVRVVMISPALDFGHGSGRTRRAPPTTLVAGGGHRGAPAGIRGSSSACTSPACRSAATSATPAPTSSTCCSRRGVDLVLTGHEHLYQRSAGRWRWVRLPPSARGPHGARCVANRGGTTFVTVGTGGTPCATCTGPTPSVGTSRR